ncbi:MAG: Ig-like domain-containing protein, partial [Ruminococcus sp.]|nr:Ig-like domain-containing protein [Ruminococcus sp.]
MSLMLFASFTSLAAKNTVQTTDAVRLRSSAEIKSDNTITTLDINEEVTLLKDSAKGWAYVSRKNGTKGYCSVDYLKVPGDSDVKFTGVTNDDVYFRKGASTDYDYIKLLSKGTSFTVADNTNELWVKATISGTTGYIYREYTDLTLKISEVQEDPVPVVPDVDTPDWFNSSALDDLPLGNVQSTASPVKLYLSDKNITIEERESYSLSAYTSDPSVVSAVSYKTSDKSVATVSDTGVIKAVSKGTATITAYLVGGDETATCSVTVIESTKPPVEDKLVLSKTALSVATGNHYHLTANLSVKWKTSDSAVVTVSNGIITAKEIGTAVVTAYTANQQVTCTVTVTKADTAVKINNSAATVTAGKTYYNGATSSDSVNWTSSDTSVAKVQNGFITAVSKGVAVVTAHNSKGTKTCLITVKDAEPVRFAYSTPNTAAIGETVSLHAVTDTSRKAVKFEVITGSKVTTVNATDKVKDGNTYIWTGTVKINS